MVGFLICSLFYTRKNLPRFGIYGPFLRGLQYYFLCAGVIGFLNPLSFIVGVLLVIRNFNGDLRDISKDKKEGLITLPIMLGFRKDIKSIHLVSMLCTSFIWWCISDISILWLVTIFIIQIWSYNITPR